MELSGLTLNPNESKSFTGAMMFWTHSSNVSPTLIWSSI